MSEVPGLKQTTNSIKKALENGSCETKPYSYWQLAGLFPENILRQLQTLSFPHFDDADAMAHGMFITNIDTILIKITIKSIMHSVLLLKHSKVVIL